MGKHPIATESKSACQPTVTKRVKCLPQFQWWKGLYVSLYCFLSSVNSHTNATTGTVLLHLYAGALARRQSRQTFLQEPIHAIYIPVPSPFPQLESFISQASKDYNLDLFKCRADLAVQTQENGHLLNKEGPKIDEPTTDELVTTAIPSKSGGEYMRQALQLYKDRFPNISAILVGTRRADPHGGGRFYSSEILCIEIPLFLM